MSHIVLILAVNRSALPRQARSLWRYDEPIFRPRTGYHQVPARSDWFESRTVRNRNPQPPLRDHVHLLNCIHFVCIALGSTDMRIQHVSVTEAVLSLDFSPDITLHCTTTTTTLFAHEPH